MPILPDFCFSQKHYQKIYTSIRLIYLLWNLYSPPYPHKSSTQVFSLERGLKVSWVSSPEFPVTLMRKWSYLAKQYPVVCGRDKKWPLNSLWTCRCAGETAFSPCPLHDTPDKITSDGLTHTCQNAWCCPHKHTQTMNPIPTQCCSLRTNNLFKLKRLLSSEVQELQ